MIDYNKLLDKLVPKPDGEDKLRLRTGTVTTVNANGTLDITMSDGVLLPGVNKLATAYAPVGAVVQIVVFRGAMLVIGAVGTSGANGAMTKTGSVMTGPGPIAATSFSTPIVFGVTFPGLPSVHVNLNGGAGATSGWGERVINVTTSGGTIFGFGSSSIFTAMYQWTATYAP
jgi:hypothetical protein